MVVHASLPCRKRNFLTLAVCDVCDKAIDMLVRNVKHFDIVLVDELLDDHPQLKLKYLDALVSKRFDLYDDEKFIEVRHRTCARATTSCPRAAPSAVGFNAVECCGIDAQATAAVVRAVSARRSAEVHAHVIVHIASRST